QPAAPPLREAFPARVPDRLVRPQPRSPGLVRERWLPPHRDRRRGVRVVRQSPGRVGELKAARGASVHSTRWPARADEGARLESVWARKRLVGSNPTATAISCRGVSLDVDRVRREELRRLGDANLLGDRPDGFAECLDGRFRFEYVEDAEAVGTLSG